MSNRMDNLQTVFDRTDWQALKAQQTSLLAAMDAVERVCRWKNTHKLQALLNWLDALQAAAEMDGYQVESLSEVDR